MIRLVHTRTPAAPYGSFVFGVCLSVHVLAVRHCGHDLVHIGQSPSQSTRLTPLHAPHDPEVSAASPTTSIDIVLPLSRNSIVN